jgi:hypothetical protein
LDRLPRLKNSSECDVVLPVLGYCTRRVVQKAEETFFCRRYLPYDVHTLPGSEKRITELRYLLPGSAKRMTELRVKSIAGGWFINQPRGTASPCFCFIYCHARNIIFLAGSEKHIENISDRPRTTRMIPGTVLVRRNHPKAILFDWLSFAHISKVTMQSLISMTTSSEWSLNDPYVDNVNSYDSYNRGARNTVCMLGTT